MKKTALITGGTRGIGLGISRALAGEGFDLALNGLRAKSEVQEVLDELSLAGSEVIYCRGNLGNGRERNSIWEQSKDHFGRINLLVNNAVKALPKKRKHQMTRNLSVNISKASLLKYQALWYSSFIAVYIWFLYWVAYDFFVWQKPIAEVNPINYVGSIAAITFMWAGRH